jgi:hypothetical protein
LPQNNIYYFRFIREVCSWHAILHTIKHLEEKARGRIESVEHRVTCCRRTVGRSQPGSALSYSGFPVHKLANDPTNRTQWPVPPGTFLPALGFLLVWADSGLTNTNPGDAGDLHANFKLSKAGGYIGLFGPDGRQIDSVAYGPQETDVSQGRWPDGTDTIESMTLPTPDAPNVVTAKPSLRLTARRSTSGSFGLEVDGPVGPAFTLQSSTNLANWANLLATNLASTPMFLFDTNGPVRQRFYRLTLP